MYPTNMADAVSIQLSVLRSPSERQAAIDTDGGEARRGKRELAFTPAV